MPIRTRITLISAGLMASVLTATGLFLFVRLESDLIDVVDEGLDSRADVLIDKVDDAGAGGRDLLGGEEALARTLGEEEAFAQIVDRDGTVLESTSWLAGRPDVLTNRFRALTEPRFETVVAGAGEGEPITVRVLAVPSDAGLVVVVGSSLEEQQDALRALVPLLWIGGPAALALVTGVVWVLTGAALRPVEHMRAEAEALSMSEPGRRLPLPSTRDEIARLGKTLNDLLGRLEAALDKERRFVDDASHELRTPLAVLRTELELALRTSRTKEELEAALRSAAEESENLSRIAEDLLVLARSDRGRLPVNRTEVDLAELSRQIVDGFRARAAERGIDVRVRTEEKLVARADALRIRQALSNVLDNALRHTPRGGAVTLEIGRDEDAVLIQVADTGPGFHPDLLSTALEPFVRDEAQRGEADGGAGLGLSIVRAVAEAHGGSVVIRNQPGSGAAVLLRLPRHARSS